MAGNLGRRRPGEREKVALMGAVGFPQDSVPRHGQFYGAFGLVGETGQAPGVALRALGEGGSGLLGVRGEQRGGMVQVHRDSLRIE